MAFVNEIIDTLWHKQKVMIPAGHESLEAVLTRPGNFFDIVLSNAREPMGFITLKHEGKGRYSIVNDTKVNPHPTFVNTPGHGIEVKKRYRKRGIGAALLSLGTGIAQRDYRTKKQEAQFEIIASDITGLGLGCYQNFGFKIREGIRISEGYFNNPNWVPEINILKKKAGFLRRLKKRIRLGAQKNAPPQTEH